ncbi:hypothetical protein CPC16_001540 [Podila verticillata]|nr:hypothetical protein CPC16_001540 [Podila verticillata]
MTKRKNTRKLLNLFCLVEGEATTKAFSINIPLNNTVDDLKNLIKTACSPQFDDIAADKLTLWGVSFLFSHSKRKESILLKDLPTARELYPMDNISDVFEDTLIEKSVKIIVQRPPSGPSSKRKRLDTNTLMDAIEAAGLTEKAVVDGRSNLSRLDNKERVLMLRFMGQGIDKTNSYDSLSSTARASRGLSFPELDLISTPSSTRFPVVDTKDLYVRQVYKDLYNEIERKFRDRRHTEIAARVVMFEAYVRHIFRKGEGEFQIKDLQNGTTATFNIPANPRVEWYKEIPPPSTGTLHIPKQCNHACVYLLLEAQHLSQITVSKKHDIKGPPFSSLLDELIRRNWIGSSGEALLIFIVPSEIYDDFRVQKYLISAGDVYRRVPQQIQQVRQFVLKIDLTSASTGQSPGLRGSAC